MKTFLDEDFLLETAPARQLFHQYAKQMPIIDYHCHINPKEIFEDRRFENITEVWLGGDHYKWRLMRANGIDERFITGDASPKEKFEKWAETLSVAIGNPLYHWSHLELRRYFGYNGLLNAETADEVWKICNKKLAEELTVREIIRRSNVEVICTTDDPVDSLEWHDKIAADSTFKTRVIPAWRPDKAMNIEKNEYLAYLKQIEAASQIKIDSFSALMKALTKRLDFFESKGCKLSDHALDFIMYKPASKMEIEHIFASRLNNNDISHEEALKFKTAFMQEMAREYSKRGWVMQLHFGCKRDNNSRMFTKLGPDTGYDSSNNYAPNSQLADFLNSLDRENTLPKTILYSLNDSDNYAITTVMGCFQDGSSVGKIQHGSAWWHNDHIDGMTAQIKNLANTGLLSAFVGMLTDSRSFLSYTRHEYFRRILCRIIGGWVENGELPDDMEALGKIVQNISYNNAHNYFKF